MGDRKWRADKEIAREVRKSERVGLDFGDWERERLAEKWLRWLQGLGGREFWALVWPSAGAGIF